MKWVELIITCLSFLFFLILSLNTWIFWMHILAGQSQLINKKINLICKKYCQLLIHCQRNGYEWFEIIYVFFFFVIISSFLHANSINSTFWNKYYLKVKLLRPPIAIVDDFLHKCNRQRSLSYLLFEFFIITVQMGRANVVACVRTAVSHRRIRLHPFLILCCINGSLIHYSQPFRIKKFHVHGIKNQKVFTNSSYNYLVCVPQRFVDVIYRIGRSIDSMCFWFFFLFHCVLILVLVWFAQKISYISFDSRKNSSE